VPIQWILQNNLREQRSPISASCSLVRRPASIAIKVRSSVTREIEGLGAPDDAALWAQRRLPAKNQLSATDAQQVEEAFAAKLVVTQAQSAKTDDVPSEPSLAQQTSAATQIDKSVPVFAEPRRVD
jgi:hypothetical protein